MHHCPQRTTMTRPERCECVPGFSMKDPENVMKAISILSGADQGEIFSRSRKQKRTFARHLVHYSLIRFAGMDLKKAARTTKRKNHVTAYNSKVRINDMLQYKCRHTASVRRIVEIAETLE